MYQVSPLRDGLVGLVVKASASRAEDPEFESRFRRYFSGSSHTSDFKIGNQPTNNLRSQLVCLHNSNRASRFHNSSLTTMPLWQFVGCLTSHQHASVSQGRICSNSFTCCHTEIEVADQTFHLTQSQCTDTGPTSPSTTDPLTPCAWLGSHWSVNV